ncbi:cobalt transporter [Infirmifilum uzonense]|uniref:Cobalt transporter n=1 Tax=Infirmifilum uzonense TaxID=1550241 RepID=A0A0F7FHM0_9CREN|nr:energy-coupling factor transporter transmembrane component T [Infirmifilum uzonense]AKG38353.1 cobalt transporter [Infirmifilum uzonense]
MSENIVRYIEGDSVVHRLDPRAKIIFVFLFIASTLVASNLFEVLLLLLLSIGFYSLARLPLRKTLPTWKFIFLIVVFLSFLNLFVLTLLYPKEGHTLLQAGPIKVTYENLISSITPVVRLLSIASVTLTLIFTTPPNLYAPALGQMGLPYKAAYVVELSFRYIPEMIGELRKTLEAQMARGYRPSGGNNPLGRVLRVIPLILPVTLSAALNVYDIADAMELRGFGASGCHTWYRQLRMRRRDYLLIAIGSLVFVSMLLTRTVFSR